ncbi:MAG: serine--tRNA ligase [Candidatus Yanofskybacteria bacterium RIFCSPHIGHO2_02_FULL_38_22b]|uniref:Serine--tRNA ligase n=1 Tax=Candidatus Yanofskybacteria bacterium RIFCSPHIGHO2_02_FULL_38_22b TaxID=1802673 RepID=A0A1F8F2H7_9BACT|nr:MAG: serine--tRNA ligase [Candidatus Yanofskybacteria bacterium RIFCSPHIGHO2_02_FULL_38_22b]OGN20386.1 MAG: serine--tRNA ligase [Candidatus Yanofskybacteria bacterium RIFCSPLOWO2_01_FULL_39_28]
MLDIKFIRQNIEIVKKAIQNKNIDLDLDKLLAADERKRHVMTELEQLRSEQNKKSKGPQSPENIEESRGLKEKIKLLEKELEIVDKEFNDLALKVPNIPSEDTPVGKDESENKVLRQVGKITQFNFKPKEHWELGQELDVIDMERAAKVSGARFAYRKGAIPLLELAVINYTFSVLTNEDTLKKIGKKAKLDISSKPFRPIFPPVMIKPEVFQKMDRLEPKEERYHIPSDDIYLIGSAEHTIGSMHMDETLKEEEMPVRYIGFSTAFRREAGSYGKDVKGLIRMHQFDKLEIESFTLPENSQKEQDFIVAIIEHMVQDLGLPYQVLIMCTGDMGKQDARHIDIEIWMPGQNKYRETHTSDLMTDFQARRLNTKVKRVSGESQYVHMNDATAFALSRIVVAIMENYQTEKGTIKIPKVLQKYTGFKEIK